MRALLLTIAFALPAQAQSDRAQVALKKLFPQAERFTPKDVFLTEEMAARLQTLARAKISERMVTFYAASAGGQTLGYAALHTHKVRTKNETLAVAFEPDGRLRRIDVALFLEPQEYEPPPKWLAQFKSATTSSRLTVGDDLDGITGATLSARGAAETARWLLQTFQEVKVATPKAVP